MVGISGFFFEKPGQVEFWNRRGLEARAAFLDFHLLRF